MNVKPDAREPDELSAAEAEEQRRQTRARRLADLPPFVGASKAAWALALSQGEFARLVRSGRLPVYQTLGRFQNDYARVDLIALAETLEK